MTPEIISLILFGVQELVKRAPALATEFQALFASGNPTAEQWDALRARVAAKSYEELVPNTFLKGE